MKGFFSRPAVMMVIAALNAAGLVGGYFWYAGQLVVTPLLLWPVVPDCPLAAGFVAWALLRRLRGRPSPWWDALAWASSIKYGMWTVVIIGHSWLAGAPMTAPNVFLFCSHLGMLFQGGTYGAALWPVRLRYLLLPAGWFLINDVADYALGVHPHLPLPGQVPLAMVTAAVTTAFALGVLCLVSPEVRRGE